ncbi:Fe-S cluster assembly protein SufD [Acrocarpospora catenulata]|uniref:Fe-S cluster assembly protein SufD n=1 Tax=Acrocarpospora catenulata TaxID=2836182 RepID=UPI001BDAB111|nr:Fe-S cluster assembly protein SufD [Acrocarpospora catenulata]
MGLETKPLVTLHENASFDLADFPVPTGREEVWRFTPLSRLKGLHDGSAAADGVDKVELSLPEGVGSELVGRDDPRVGKAGKPADRVAAQAYASFEKATVITVPREAVLAEPIRVDVHGQGGTLYTHLVVEVGPLAEAVVVITNTGTGVRAGNVEFLVGDGAKVTVVSVQEGERDAVHVAQHTALLGRDAAFKSVLVTLGGDLVRISPRVGYTGPGGDAELVGLYFADAGQHLEHRLLVDHSVPNCRSDVIYKGGLQGDDAHAVWIGDVIIRPEAVGTDTYELNRNLLLTDGARADSVPNLEILTGEIVGAGHASASGRLDDEHLFYLQARGIPEIEARRLVVHGFFNELIQRIEVPEVQEKVLAAVEAELSR